MQLLGPFPGSAQLVRLSRDPEDSVRAKAVYLMGIHPDEATGARLVELLHDPNPVVQRIACESLVRSGQQATWTDLVPLLASEIVPSATPPHERSSKFPSNRGKPRH